MMRRRLGLFAGRHGWYFEGGVPSRARWVVGGVLACTGLWDVSRGGLWSVPVFLFGVYVPFAHLRRKPSGPRSQGPLDVPGAPPE